MPRQPHFYGLNHLHYLTTSTDRRPRLFGFTRWLSPIRRHANYGMSAPPATHETRPTGGLISVGVTSGALTLDSCGWRARWSEAAC